MSRANSSPGTNLRLSLCSIGSLWLICIYQAPLVAQQTQSLSDPAYMLEVTQKVDSLIEHKYVLPALAREHASEFRRRYMAGAYRAFTDPSQFAEKVTADLVEISGDAHFSFRSIAASELGEEAESNLRHPLRPPRMRSSSTFAKMAEARERVCSISAAISWSTLRS